MATGVPRTPNRQSKNLTDPILEYQNKKSREEILSTPASKLERIIAPEHTGTKRLFFGENLGVLAQLSLDDSVRGKVRLIYIDPPFATQSVFHTRKLAHAYQDVFEKSEYLEFLRERLILLHHILADDGSIYLHLDAKMVFYVKVLMDEIFGADNFRNCITRKKSNPKNYTRKQFGNVSDYILFYTKTPNYIWNQPFEPWTEERAREYQYVDIQTGRRFMKVPIHAPGIRNGETGKLWRGKAPPPGKHWQFPPSVLDEMDARGEIYWSKNGNPRRKVYLDASAGPSVQDIWLDYRDAHNQMAHISGYPTEKNINLLKRIVEASSNPGDIVLDCFAGSGTTLVAADTLHREWIGVDNSSEAIRTILHRFEHGVEPMGTFADKKLIAPQTSETPLFLEELPAAATKMHTKIEDFSFFSELSEAEVARSLIQDPKREKLRA